MPPPVTRQMIDQIDDPVLESANAEAENDVRDQRLCDVHAPMASFTARSP